MVESGHGEWSREEVCQVYVSLARTLEDCGQFSQALFFYNKEVSLLKDKPAEVGGAVGCVKEMFQRRVEMQCKT